MYVCIHNPTNHIESESKSHITLPSLVHVIHNVAIIRIDTYITNNIEMVHNVAVIHQVYY